VIFLKYAVHQLTSPTID